MLHVCIGARSSLARMNASVLKEAHACMIQAVSTNTRPVAGAWTRLGAYFEVVHDDHAAAACFEAADRKSVV